MICYIRGIVSMMHLKLNISIDQIKSYLFESKLMNRY
jgi:hypothetical protein